MEVYTRILKDFLRKTYFRYKLARASSSWP